MKGASSGPDRMAERREIAALLEAADKQRRSVNDQPEVIAARAKSDRAHREADACDAEFRRIFDKHHPRDGAIQRALMREHPDLKVIGGGIDNDTSWIARCCVTGLPIFEGDNVIERGGEEDYERTYVLADCVKVDAGLCLPSRNKTMTAPTVAQDSTVA